MLTEENLTWKFEKQYIILFTCVALFVLYSIMISRNKMIMIFFFSPSFYYAVPLELFSVFFPQYTFRQNGTQKRSLQLYLSVLSL